MNDPNITIVELPSFEERRALHDEGKCDAWCGICYQEACDFVEDGLS